MKILFFDPVAQKPYTAKSLTTQPMGASEASLIRVARELAKEHSVAVFQLVDAHRKHLVIEGVQHINENTPFSPDVVVHMRSAEYLEMYPEAKNIVWLQDAAGDWLKKGLWHLADNVVCLTNWHIQNIQTALNDTKYPPIRRIYNPVDLDGVFADLKVPDRLGFFSSPHKGLQQVVELFNELKKSRSELELVVGNPGYMPDVIPEGVRFLGSLPHPLAMKELSRCQALFYPQTVFPETMGVIMAEANALGVPVLAHDMGAAVEVLITETNKHHNFVIDCTNHKHIKNAVEYMLEPCPTAPTLDARFELSAVLEQWRQLLEG